MLQRDIRSTIEAEFEFFFSSGWHTIAFRYVTLEDDLERLCDWMNRPHIVPFWRLNKSFDELCVHFEQALRDPHQTLFIGMLDGTPMSYWESYWTKDDVVAHCYAPDPADQGIHMLIGPSEFLGKGLALPLLRAMVSFLFRHSPTQRIVAEPDIRNTRMIHVFERCGFEFADRVQLPGKEAALMFCHRPHFAAEDIHAKR